MGNHGARPLPCLTRDGDSRCCCPSTGFETSSPADEPLLLPGSERFPEPGTPAAYVGSYGKLSGFLQECSMGAPSALSQARYRDLLAALNELSCSSGDAGVVKMQPWFKDQQSDAMGLLPAFGIDVVTKSQSLRRFGSRRDPMTPVRQVDYRQAGEDGDSEDYVGELLDYRFCSRDYGHNVSADVQFLLTGFSSPYNLLDRYKLNTEALGSWIATIANHYENHAYHNWQHAIDVFQFLYLCVVSGGLGAYLSSVDILAILVAAIAHDVAHPGFNNAYIVNIQDRLAITYNDKSPLENMHASTAFEALKTPGCDFMKSVIPEDFKNFRAKVIDAILATDMCHHFELVDKFSACASKTQDAGPEQDLYESLTKDDRRLLIQTFTHMADLGHCCRPWAVHKILVVALEDEFFLQGDEEKDRSMPISPLMDRTKDSMAAAQDFFLSKMVVPLLQPCAKLLKPEVGFFFTNNVEDNKRRWKELVDRHGKLTARELLPLAKEKDGHQENGTVPNGESPVESAEPSDACLEKS